MVAFDSNYNRLQSTDASTLFLYQELKKNSEITNQNLKHFDSNTSKEEQATDSFFVCIKIIKLKDLINIFKAKI